MKFKSCLKRSSGASTPQSLSSDENLSSLAAPGQPCRPTCSRTVSFLEKDADEVHIADDWDRSSVDVTPKLSYDDILELKQMQIAAARASARASKASGTSSRILSHVPLTLLPLLPESAAATASPVSPASPSSPRPASPQTPGSPPLPSTTPIGLSFSDACLCRVFSADAGARAHGLHGHAKSCALHPSNAAAHAGAPHARGAGTQHLLQTPSPPDTPPRPLVTSIPAPPPTARARHFAFLPLLETPCAAPSPSASAAPSASCYSSPVRAASASPPPGPSAPRHPGAYSTYEGPGAFVGVGGSGSLGLERKLGLAAPHQDLSGSESGEEEREDEEAGWACDCPSARRQGGQKPAFLPVCQPVHPPAAKQTPSTPTPPPSPPPTAGLAPSSPSPSRPKSRAPLCIPSASPSRSSRCAELDAPPSPSSPGPRELSVPSPNSRERGKPQGRKMRLPLVALA
ncbi:hypothetical protein DFH11DRAFT_1827785 [Phellopilus nigrolimitatus]|nr:hypothetical protein DFH11DRAFT_1827785 [Phellopilus nigrolimitatus]